MSRRKQANPKPLKVVPPGETVEGGEELVTLADHENTHTNTTQDYEEDPEDEDDDFCPLVIDTQDGETPPSTPSKDKSGHLLHHSKDMDLYRENNPSDTEESSVSVTGTPLKDLEVSLTRCELDTTRDSSSPCSRVSSPTLSITSKSGSGSAKPTQRQSQPNKARKKTDKILPVEGEKYVCPVCKQVLLSNVELTKHIRSHNTNAPVAANTCTICSKVLSSQSSLDRHMLVHSGERPFKCKICNMAFTTNGNMHRHSRIHDKEVDSQGKFMLPKENGCSSRMKQKTKKTHEDPEYAEQMMIMSSAKKKVPPGGGSMLGVSPGELKRKLSFDNVITPSSKRHSPDTSLLSVIVTSGSSPVVTTSENMASPSVLDDTLLSIKQGEDTDDVKELHCPVCQKTFLSQYGLDTHLQDHPGCKLHCQLCGLSFHNLQALSYHSFTAHQRPRPSLFSPMKIENGIDTYSNVPVGFHELTFMDFTCEKFPLVSQVWCDNNVRRASSQFHNFTCSMCEKAFPCRTALNIHQNSHGPENLNHCSICDTNFEDVKAYKNHMVSQHVGKSLIARCVNKLNDLSDEEDTEVQDLMSKEDFLTAMNLRVNKIKAKTSNRMETDEDARILPQREESKDNLNYFKTLHRITMPHKNGHTAQPPHFIIQGEDSEDKMSKRVTISENNDSNDFADIQQIITRFGSGGGLVHFNNSASGPPTLKPVPRLQPVLQPAGSQPSTEPPSLVKVEASGTQDFKKMKRLAAGMGRPSDMTLLHPEGMRLPVMVPNGLVPILPKKEQEAGGSNSSSSTEVFKCRYCPEVFNNCRAYKGHIRTHLGLSPYKCNLCPYSSADKSTLIRHLRTHNGERPFQCRICEFAFTTKANCERHVRKKHLRDSKRDIEDAIGYNQFINETPPDFEAFASPDTVCKYCGEDFKFFRALKHHLRSHSSCRHKPFLCKICNNGFSTKANCVRHVQKQHPEIDQHLLEDHIHTNELLVAVAAAEAKMLEGMDDQSLSPGPSSSPSNPQQGAYLHGAFMQISPISVNSPRMTPPMTPPQSQGIAIRTVAGSSTGGRMLMSTPVSTSGTYITSPPITTFKMDAQDTDEDQPLDFSMKTKSPSNVVKHEVKQECEEEENTTADGADQPMDLTIRKLPTTSMAYKSELPLDVAPRTMPPMLPSQSLGSPDYGMLRYKKEYQKFYNPTVGRLQCPYCKMLFKHGLKLQVHIRSHTNERPFSCIYCSASFTIKTNLERHLKTRHPQRPPYIPDVMAMTTDEGIPERLDDDSSMDTKETDTSNHTIQPLMISVSPKSSLGSDDSSCELSSVTKILDATNSTHFRGFFSVNTESPVEPGQFKQTPFEAYQDQQEDEADSVSDGPDCDEIESEMEAHTAAMTKNTTAEGEEEMDEKSGQLATSLNPDKCSSEGNSPAVKKKRNSYADSPHKLVCPYCPRAFPWISSLNRHILTHTGQKPFKCPQCSVMFSTKSNRERHLVRKHGLNVLDPATRQMMDRPFKCHLCVFSSFSTAGNLLKHYHEKHPDTNVPEHLKQESASDTNNNDSYTTECQENSYASQVSEAKRLGLHFEEDEDEDKDGIPDGVCSKMIDHVQPLKMDPVHHYSQTPRASPIPSPPGTPDRQQINPERDNYNVDKITECWKCDEEFVSRKVLLRHLKEHNIDLSFKCYLCDASFDCRSECLLHKANRHPNDWGVLREKNQVGKIDEFADCMNRIVEQNFIGNNNYGKKVTEAEVAKYKVQLSEDMKPESDYTQRKVYCSLCPKRFWSLQDLRRHMRSHTGERPFECDVCQKRFTLKHSMMRHRRKHVEPGVGSLSASDDENHHHIDTDHCVTATWKASSLQRRKQVMPSPALNSEGDQINISDHSEGASDLLHNLLGVEISEELLSSPDSAARLLGVHQ